MARWSTGGGSGGGTETPDASTTVKGKVQLAGDLAGTAAAPTVPALGTKVNSSTYVAGIGEAKERANHTGTQAAASIADLTETVQDIVGALIVAGTGTTVSYDDAAGTFTINATASGGGTTDPEVVRDTIGGALVAGSGIQITVNDVGDTITVASTAVLPTRTISTTAPLTGGGDLSANRTLSVSAATADAQGVVELATDAETTTGTDTTRAVTPAGLKAVADTKAAATIAANTQTGTAYTLVAADAGRAVEMNSTAANTATIPASVFTAGQVVEIHQYGAGQTTIVAGSGLTLRAPDGTKLAKQYASASLRFRSATEAVLAGNTVA